MKWWIRSVDVHLVRPCLGGWLITRYGELKEFPRAVRSRRQNSGSAKRGCQARHPTERLCQKIHCKPDYLLFVAVVSIAQRRSMDRGWQRAIATRQTAVSSCQQAADQRTRRVLSHGYAAHHGF